MQRTLIVFALCVGLLPACQAQDSSSPPAAVTEAPGEPAAPEPPAAPEAPAAPGDAIASPAAPPAPSAPRQPASANQPAAPAKVTPPPAEPAPPAPTPPVPETAPVPGAPSHRQWDDLLRRYVGATGKVDYAGFQKDKAALQQYLDLLAANPVADNWSRQEKMAYWINAYNAFTVKLIVDNYPVNSIRDLDKGNPWDVARIRLGTRTYSLNGIENDILRPQFQDARIHFAINCAARSCPPLLNRAFTAERLDQQLDQQARQFINNAAFNQLSANKANVSKIFEWYAKDFGNLVDFLNRYADTKLPKDAAISYVEYDWALNQ